jgi:hypothetical protein
LVLGEIGEVVEVSRSKRSKRSNRLMAAAEAELPARDLRLLNEIRGARKHEPPSVLESEADGQGELALPAAWRPNIRSV